MVPEESSEADATPEMSDIPTVDVSTLLAAKKSQEDTVEYTFTFENWDGKEACIKYVLKRPVFAQGFAFGLEEAEATASEVTQKWLRGDDRSKEPLEAYAAAFYVSKELVKSPRSFATRDGVLALPPAARMELPRLLCKEVGLGPKFWRVMRGDSDAGEVLAELLRQLSSAGTSPAPQHNSDENSSPEKPEPSSSPSEPPGSGSDETES